MKPHSLIIILSKSNGLYGAVFGTIILELLLECWSGLVLNTYRVNTTLNYVKSEKILKQPNFEEEFTIICLYFRLIVFIYFTLKSMKIAR